jgi:outer membrane protein assembly factor BamB
MFDVSSIDVVRRGFVSPFLMALSVLAMTSPRAWSQETAASPAPAADEAVEENSPDLPQEGEEIETEEPPPPPPDGILPVAEMARFEYSPRDHPHVLMVAAYLIITTRGGIIEGIDAATGKSLWKLGLPGEELFPAVVLPPREKLSILLSTPSGHLLLLDGKTGRIESEKRLPFQLATEPFVSEASVLYMGTPDGIIHAHDLASDEERFATDTGEAPKAFASSSQLVVVSGAVQTLTALDATTGSVIWTHRGRGAFYAPAAFDREGKRLYVGSDTGEFYGLEASSGKVRFTWPTGAAIRAPALVEGRRVYVASYGNTLYAYRGGSGDEQWRANLPGRPASGPVRIYQRLIVATQDGTLVEIEPSRGSLGESYAAPGEILGSPAYHIVPPPPPTVTMPEEPDRGKEPEFTDEATPLDGDVEEPKEPKWYELTRIALSLRSGQVLLLRHQLPAPPSNPEVLPPGEVGDEDEPSGPDRPGAEDPVPF